MVIAVFPGGKETGGVALYVLYHLASRLKREHGCTSIPPLGHHDQIGDGTYLYLYLMLRVYISP